MPWDRETSTAPRAPHALAALLIAALALPGALASLGAGAGPAYRGRPLVEVLRELQQRGVDLVFSSAVVGEDLRVVSEPSSTEPRALLEEVLAPLGLRVEEGPAGALLILPRDPGVGMLSGRVVSASRGRPLARASVRLAGTGRGATSASDGSFRIEGVPVGTYRAIVEAPGFVSATIGPLRITSAEPTELTAELRARPSFVTEVVVTPGRHALVRQEQSTRHTVTSEDAVLAPTIGGDISRLVELLPGVATADNSAAFNVRGSIARDVSLVLDGLELYDPFHLQSFQSPFSLVDSNVVDRIDFFGGGFTAELGDRHGGFVEISTVVPEIPGEGEVELGTLNSRVSYRGPLSRSGASWLVSARAWYPEAVHSTTELGGGENLDPRFGDLYAKVAFHPSPRHVLSAHGLASYDRLEFVETRELINEAVDARTSSGYGWVRLLSAWSERFTSETVASGGRIERARGGISGEGGETVVDDDRAVRFLGLRHDSIWQISGAHVLKAGLELRRLSARYRYLADFTGDPPTTTAVRLDPRGTSLGLYVAHRTRVASILATEVGLRWDRQTYTRDNQLSPRFNAVLQPGERSELRLALGRFHQSQRIHELQVEDAETEFRRAEVSEEAEVSFLHRFGGDLRLRLDAYERRLSRLRPRYENLFEPVELFPETTQDRVLVEPARARLRGVELLLRGGASRPLFWWASYTLSSAEDVIEGRDVPRSWDQTHAGKFLVGYRRGERWSVSLSGAAHTGWPTTPVSGLLTTEPGEAATFEIDPGPRNSARYPRYFRLDGKVRRALALPRGRLWLTLEVTNLTDRHNACCINDFLFQQRPDGTVDARPRLDYWLGITPSFSVLWRY